MVDPPKVDMPPAKIYKEVLLPKTDDSKGKKKNKELPTEKSLIENDKNNHLIVVIVVLVVLLLAASAGFVVHRVTKNWRQRARRELDIEMQSNLFFQFYGKITILTRTKLSA